VKEPPFFVSSRLLLWLCRRMCILALHGFTGRGSDFAPFAQLIGGTWHCPDLPGHGPDPLKDCSPEATLRFLEKEIAGFPAQTSPKILLGYSMGARAALLHATRFPEYWDALVLISANPGIPEQGERAARAHADSKLADRIEDLGVDAFLDHWQQTPMIRSQETIPAAWRQAMQEGRGEQTAEGLAQSLRQFGQCSFHNLWPELGQLQMPTLLLTGDGDPKYTAIAQSMDIAHKSHAIIEQAGHMPHLEQAETSRVAIRSFLKSLAP